MVFLMPRESGVLMFDRNMSPVRSRDGAFEIRGVTPGSYVLTAQSFDGQDQQHGRVPVDVGNTSLDGLELTLSPGQEVAGTIKVEGDGNVSPSAIRVFLEPKEMFLMGGGGGMSATKQDGSFTIRNIVPQTYRVRTVGEQSQVYVKSVYVGHEEAKDGEITITPGVSPALAVIVSTAGAQISGEVKGDNDAPVQGATVVLVPDAAKRQQTMLFKNTSTDQYGRFTLTAIAPGTYKVFAWDGVESGEWMDPDFLQPFESKGVAVTLKEGSKETAALTLLQNASGAKE
jgi:hypothetical protein